MIQVVTVTQENFIPVRVPLVTLAATAVVGELLLGADTAPRSLLDRRVPGLRAVISHFSLQLKAMNLAHVADSRKGLEFI